MFLDTGAPPCESDYVLETSSAAKRSRWAQMLATARVANTWLNLKKRHVGAAFRCKNHRAFRRAYVTTWLEKAVTVTRSVDGSLTLDAMGGLYARVHADGSIHDVYPSISLSLAPRNVNELAGKILWARVEKMRCLYSELSGGDELLSGWLHIFEATQRKALKGFLIAAMRQLNNAIAPEARRIIRSLAVTCAASQKKLANADPVVAQRWCQAFRQYPALMRFQCDDDYLDRKIVEVVEQGKPLVTHFAQHYGVSEAAIRRLRGKHYLSLIRFMRMKDSFESTMRHVAGLPQHLHPNSRDDYVNAMKMFRLTGIRPENVKDLTKGIKVPLGNEKRIDQLVGFQDVLESFNRNCHGDVKSMEMAVATGLASLSLGAVIKLNRDWHRAHNVATHGSLGSFVEIGETATWTPLLHGPVQAGSLTAVELTTHGALANEGATQGHCVGGYATNCLMGLSRIISLRNSKGDSVSTVEFRQQPCGKLIVAQHHGRNNTAPPKEAVKALRSLRVKMRQESVASKAIWPRLDTLTTAHSSAIDACMTEFWKSRFPAHAELFKLYEPRVLTAADMGWIEEDIAF